MSEHANESHAARRVAAAFRIVVMAVVAASAAPLRAQTVLRWRSADDPDAGAGQPAQSRAATVPAADGACTVLRLCADGDPGPGGGTLVPVAWAGSCGINRAGEVAFVARIVGAPQNQGVFVADAGGVRTVALGCGGGGGSGQPGSCGDAAPGGGTFAGCFLGTPFAPSIDDEGNVLFLADVVGGVSSRALFLGSAGGGTLVRIAGVGDALPGGGTIAAIGPGVLGHPGTVLFAARRGGGPGGGADLYRWRAGVVQPFALAGDALPGGGVMGAPVTESLFMVDGTDVPIGPLPAMNSCGAAAYRAIGSAGSPRGLLFRSDLQDASGATWLVRAGDAVPGGGTFLQFEAPVLNGSGEFAVFADFQGAAGPTSGWFVGRPGTLRRALAFHDPVDDGTCLGLAVSRGPMTPLDDEGNLVVWCDLALAGGEDRIVECRADGALRVVARRGGAAPGGGTFGVLGAWPTRSSSGRTVVSARVLAGAVADGHFAAIACEPIVAVSPCARVGGALRVDDQGPDGSWFVLGVSTIATELPLPPWGTLRIGPTPLWLLTDPTPYPGATRPHTGWWQVPADQALVGTEVHFQSLRSDGITGPGATATLSNRATVRLGR